MSPVRKTPYEDASALSKTPSQLVLATRNRKKMEEIRRVLGQEETRLLTLDDFPGCPEVEEDAATFRDNAAKKALTVARHSGQIALADDSGLLVDGLDGAPGVRSARYAGENANDADNLALLLAELASRPEASRAARFECVLALADPAGSLRFFAGTVAGRIGHEARGVNGFGYDPIFIPDGHERTFAEMPASMKDSMSHRGRALEAFASAIHNIEFNTRF
ncbi:MAG: RdgB/HAM1 family non-canonical purine NTP pyrophosphatase [Magnetococcales bacterium]|nr:RdgB/HAM1 family non-canonical purine NTP pyrophosphatase [Magnetococcales bacterium]